MRIDDDYAIEDDDELQVDVGGLIMRIDADSDVVR